MPGSPLLINGDNGDGTTCFLSFLSLNESKLYNTVFNIYDSPCSSPRLTTMF